MDLPAPLVVLPAAADGESLPSEYRDRGGLGGHPSGLTSLFFTEFWERFSYYGMRALLTLFMLTPIAAGGLGFEVPRAARIYGDYTMAVYLLAVPGGFIADRFLGARRSVLIGGSIIALGHYAMIMEGLPSFYAGLVLIALGTGLLKPNITAMVGQLYRPADPRRDSGYSLFYMGINLGAFVSPLITGFLAQSAVFKSWLEARGFDPNHSWHWGFGAAGVGMTIGLIGYIAQSDRLAHVGHKPRVDARAWAHAAGVLLGTGLLMAIIMLSDQPSLQWLRGFFLLAPIAVILGFGFRRDLESKRLAAIGVLFIAAMIFWAVIDQAGSTVVLFGDRFTRTEIFGWEFPSSWFQSLAPFFVVLLAPGFAWLWATLGPRQPSIPIKFTLGLVFLGLSLFLMVPAAELTAHGRVSPWWLVGLMFIQTLGEMCIGPVGQSAMTKLAPGKVLGLIMGFWMLTLSFGDKLAGILAGTFRLDSAEARAAFFSRQALAVGVLAVIFFSLAPWVRRLMGGVK